MKKLLLSVLAAGALLATGCGSSSNSDFVFQGAVAPAQAQVSTRTQVEFLARPGIAEALLFDNALLAAYNAVTPRFVAAALADANSAEGQAAAPIFAQATTVLNILENVDNDATNGLTVAQLTGAFLPDVMRIDTTLATNVGDSAYGRFNNAGTTLAGGRKLTDDVIDITLQTLTDGFVMGDGVPYYPVVGNPAVGHSNLNGQTVQFGAATFPYLAPPQ